MRRSLGELLIPVMNDWPRRRLFRSNCDGKTPWGCDRAAWVARLLLLGGTARLESRPTKVCREPSPTVGSLASAFLLAALGIGPARGDVWTVSLSPVIGHEQGGVRPALIVSANVMNQSPAGLLFVAPITGTDRGIMAHVRIPAQEAGLTKASVILTDQVRSISLKRLGRKLGRISSATMAEAEQRLALLLGL
jgi:mRNA interferase MazF